VSEALLVGTFHAIRLMAHALMPVDERDTVVDTELFVHLRYGGRHYFRAGVGHEYREGTVENAAREDR
jgi:hypothetical protein